MWHLQPRTRGFAIMESGSCPCPGNHKLWVCKDMGKGVCWYICCPGATFQFGLQDACLDRHKVLPEGPSGRSLLYSVEKRASCMDGLQMWKQGKHLQKLLRLGGPGAGARQAGACILSALVDLCVFVLLHVPPNLFRVRACE